MADLSGFIKEHSIIIVLAIAAVFTFVWLRLTGKRLSISAPAAAVISVLHVVVGVLCVKVFAFLESFGKAAPGAMSLFGAVFFLPAFYYFGAKLFGRKTTDVFDVFSICMIFTLFCARINCIISGCCLGRIMNTSTGFRWPTREAELVFYAVFLIIMIPRVLKGITAGKVYPIYMLSYGIFRSVTEIFRESASAGILHISHIWAFISLAVGASVYIELRNRPKAAGNHKKRAH